MLSDVHNQLRFIKRLDFAVERAKMKTEQR